MSCRERNIVWKILAPADTTTRTQQLAADKREDSMHSGDFDQMFEAGTITESRRTNIKVIKYAKKVWAYFSKTKLSIFSDLSDDSRVFICLLSETE